VSEVLPEPIEAASGGPSPVRPGDLRVVGERRPGDLLLVVLAGDARGVREAEALVRAFIGPSYASAKDPRRVLVPGMELTEHVKNAGGEVARVLAVPPAVEAGAVAAITRMLAVRARRPAALATHARPIASVLRDIEAAIARSDVAGGRNFLREAESTGRLTLLNRSLLEVRLVALESDGPAVLSYARSHRLTDLTVPAAVQETVLEAYGSVHLLPKAAEGAAAVLEEHDQAGAAFAAYFVDHRRSTSSGSRLAWAAHYARVRPRPTAAIRELLEAAPAEERPFLEVVLTTHDVPEQAAEPAHNVAKNLRSAGEDAAAWSEASDSAAGVRASDRDQALDAAAAVGDPVRRDEASGGGPFAGVEDWRTWLLAVYERPDEGDADRVLRDGSQRWSAALNDTAETLEDLAEVIEALAGERVLNPALPLLNEALADGSVDPELRRRRKAVDLALAYVLPRVTDPGLTDVEVLVEVVGRLLDSGLATEQYIGLIEGIERLHERLAAPAALGQAIADAIDFFLNGAAPSGEDREAAIRRLAALLLGDARRARPLIPSEVYAQIVEVLEEHAEYRDLLAPVRQAAESGEAEDSLAELTGKSILLHTLIEAAGARAKAYVQQRVDCQVSLDASMVGSDALRAAAASADVVVIAWRAAKHSAYETLKDAARPGALRYARGKGWSSLVAALRQ
jgi:hypothetical protein